MRSRIRLRAALWASVSPSVRKGNELKRTSRRRLGRSRSVANSHDLDGQGQQGPARPSGCDPAHHVGEPEEDLTLVGVEVGGAVHLVDRLVERIVVGRHRELGTAPHQGQIVPGARPARRTRARVGWPGSIGQKGRRPSAGGAAGRHRSCTERCGMWDPVPSSSGHLRHRASVGPTSTGISKSPATGPDAFNGMTRPTRRPSRFALNGCAPPIQPRRASVSLPQGGEDLWTQRPEITLSLSRPRSAPHDETVKSWRYCKDLGVSITGCSGTMVIRLSSFPVQMPWWFHRPLERRRSQSGWAGIEGTAIEAPHSRR